MFDNLIFTDESSIWLEQHNKLCFRKKGVPAKLKLKVKHPYKVHVWAGSYKNPHLHRHNEEGILCAEHPKGHPASVIFDIFVKICSICFLQESSSSIYKPRNFV